MLKTPPMQTATATIDTLCGRLQSATLLEDRRAAILGLRSFAKQFPASVASGSLRELISTLKRDGLGDDSSRKSQDGEQAEGGDVDTIRLVMETLLMLFSPDSNSPEAGDEIALFLADEFSMRQDNLSILLHLLDPTSPYADYYSRLYAVQILSAICAARPDRLQECILAAPLGVSRLVGILDDGRDAVRNAGLLLLVDLTSGANEELRKIVAFEDVFSKTFALIQLEGGLAEAGITAQDCLSLLANLIRGSSTNQTMFRESGCVAQLVQLLQQAFPTADELPFNAQAREKAAWGLLMLLRLFLVPGEASTPQNQTAFFRAGIAQVLIDLGYTLAIPVPVRSSALRAAAALIESNAPLQEQFAALTVVTPEDADHNAAEEQKQGQTNGTTPNARGKKSARASLEKRRSYIIEALLSTSLDDRDAEAALRAAACGLIQAYLSGHDRVKAHFLQRAINGHAEGETTANVLHTLLHPPEGDETAVVHASWIVQGLIGEELNAKTMFISVSEGNEEEGEDMISIVQALGSHLHAALQTPIDTKTVAAFASLLSTLLWDFAPGVDDLLAEGSSLLQGLVAVVKTPDDPIIAGLAAMLLGIVYEFSTKDSPIPRRTLAPLVQQKLGRTKYLDALLQLRRVPAIRDFDLDQETDEGGDGMLSHVFVDLFTVEYTRLRRAIDKDPGVEVLPASAAEAGVDRDVLDELRKQAQAAKDALAVAQQEALDATEKAEQDHMTISKELQTASSEIERLRKINQAMQQGHESELEKITKQHEQDKNTIQTRHQHALNNAKQESDRILQASLREREAASAQKIQELERRIAELGNEHRKEASGHASAKQQLESTTGKLNELIKRERDLSRELDGLKQQQVASENKLRVAQEQIKLTEGKLTEARKALETSDEELSKYKAEAEELKADLVARDEELKTERSGFAELEKELDEAKQAASTISEARRSEVDAANTAADEAKADAAKAQSELETLKQQLSETKQKLTDSETKSVAAEEKVTALEKKLKDAETNQKKATASGKDSDKKIADAEKKADDAEAKVKTTEDKLKEAIQKAVTAEKKAKEAVEKAATAEKKAAEGSKGANNKANAGSTSKADKDKIAKLEKDLAEAKKVAEHAKSASGKADKAESEKLKKLEKELEEAQESAKAAQADLEKAKADSEDAEKLRKELEQAREADKDAKAELDKLRNIEVEHSKAKEELSAAKDGETKAQAELAKIKATIAESEKTQAALKAAQESEKNAKEELESMLLVMGDIEAKRDEYKEKIKSLGGEVTDEESDEDDDEDEDEDDDVD
ncbi:hypothetical protein CKM354_000541500 [Cercospora kikuchii]|uniref:Intracellular protein transport protein USO1 n=1 Tax=Cercospora kikuchii TaxID=84275 RepID=A0A9P3FCB6_9PEZI|nr:uncharacterized protein CKM354_000541500 [Cercospora kikuchii]GIZ42136.1 hypothetical protein CKM354_000541500 [Cercospora kikuchii]